jgi:hypothetical protein
MTEDTTGHPERDFIAGGGTRVRLGILGPTAPATNVSAVDFNKAIFSGV